MRVLSIYFFNPNPLDRQQRDRSDRQTTKIDRQTQQTDRKYRRTENTD